MLLNSIVWISAVAALLCTVQEVSAVCETFSKVCSVGVGQRLPVDAGSSYAAIPADEEYYLSFTLPVEVVSASVDLSVLFGSLRMYAAVNRKPSRSDFDFTNSFVGQEDILSIDASNHKGGDKFNVLIRASPASAVYFAGSVLASSQPLVMEINGMPQSFRMDRASSTQVQFQLLNSAPVQILATGYSAYLPTMSLMYRLTPASQPVPVPKSYFNNDSNAADHLLSFTPITADVGRTFVLKLTATNMSYLSLALRNGISVEGTAISGPPPKDPPVSGSSTHSLVLLSGQPQRDRVGSQQEHYYILYVPPGITGTVTIKVDPIQGDSDLFVNPPSRGFYHREGSDPLPVWSSQRASGVDTVNILPKDRDYVKNGGAYFVTVFGYDAAQYLVRGSAQDIATLLMEGYSVQDTVAKDSYKYYRFQDTNPTQSIYFDLLPSKGDADLMVGCFLQPTGTDGGYPSKLTGHNNFSSEMFMEDTLVVSPLDPKSCSSGGNVDMAGNRGGTFFLAVRGYSESTFTISAQHAFGEKLLVAGLPVTGMVYRAVAQRFKIRVGYEAAQLRVRLIPMYGDADLYARLNAPPELNTYDFRSNNFYTEVDSITIPEQEICADCWVHILVYGFQTTEYSLVATFSDDTVVLSNGVPQRGSVASNKAEYYNFQASIDSNVILVVSSRSGWVPSLYMSKSVERPDSSSSDTVSRSSDSGANALPRIVFPGVLAGQTVHIAVAGDGKNITYSIRAYEESTEAGQAPTLLTLPNGFPQDDSIANDALSSWLFYQVNAPVGHETINLRTVMEVGFIELYVTKCNSSAVQCLERGGLPSEKNYLVSTVDSESVDFVNVPRNDKAPTLYLVGVKSESYYSVYQISASFENSILALQAGIPVMDHVAERESDYFSYFFDQSYVKLTVSITTLSGDPDLFISTTVTRPTDDDQNSTWRSTEFGSDVVTIDPSKDPRACTHCTYYIAVVGRKESTYTISVSTSSNLPKLVDGVPTAGVVLKSEWVYYSFRNTYGSKRDLHIALTSSTGNADMYASLDGSIPTTTKNQYGSSNWYTLDGIDILHSDTAYIASCESTSGSSDCVVLIGVYGYMSSEYTITLTSSSSATLLQLGAVTTGTVTQAQSKYYRMMLSQSGSLSPYTLQLSVVPTSGHVRVFVACNNMQPNSTNYQWMLNPAAGSGATLDILSLAAADKGCLRIGAQYYATVYGDTAASFTITARLANDSSVPMLVPGLAHTGRVTMRAFDYFFVRPAASFEDIRLMATVFQGDVDLYVSLSWQTRPQVGSNGAVQSYVLSSAKSGSEDMTLNHNWVQDSCAQRDVCYIIVGVFGAGTSSNSYNLLTSTKDATLQLTAGVPRQSHVASNRLEYFKFTLSQPNLDVVISVTPLSGDPDLFVGMYPLTHPSRNNFTWYQSKFGADTLTLQWIDISKRCVPNPTVLASYCDIYIGVFGWQNTTFTVMANVDEGFRSPITLIDQSPQSGFVADEEYIYYRYAISVPTGGSSPPTDIKFILTPIDDGDADMFLLIIPNGNKSEPGMYNYNYKSVGWGSVTEAIEISADMPFYCFDCTVYIAVYGYRACSYSIQASSSGFTSLQSGQAIGGHVSDEKFVYYTIHNSNQFAIMQFTLTMISEDADLYISTHLPGSPFQLPTRSVHMWRSLFVGSDAVAVTYEDPHYCTNCDYIVGVYGYHNSTYTLMVTDHEDTIIKLVQNRPQIASISTRDGTLYFSAVISSSAADMTVSLTSLGTGSADLYVAIYNATIYNSAAGGDVYRLPDANIPSTYQYTTAGTEDDHVFLRGPHWQESIVVILVKAKSAVKFSIVATSSQSPVLLLAGVPQNHYVEFAANEFFKFFPHSDEDLHITLTARSGDPDLFISATSPNPHCARVTNEFYTSTVCSNYTWSSRSYMTDQVILSRDSPCSAVMPGTTVSLDCDPANSYNPSSGAPLYIGVYGYSSAKFTLLVAPVGQQVQLIAGQPQLSRTSLGFICATRSATGVCTTPASSNKKVEAAYFAFRVTGSSSGAAKKLREFTSYAQPDAFNGNSMQSVFDVVFTVVPACNTSMLPDNSDSPSPAECSPGCECAPLQFYVTSCALSKCNAADRRPSEYYGQHKLVETVKQGSGTTIVLSSSSSAGFCDPGVVGEDCAYYVAVVATPLPALSSSSAPRLESAVFTITARTPGDMVLVPCIGEAYPDGIQFEGEDFIMPHQPVDFKNPRNHRPSYHYYEVCSQKYLPSSQTSSESLIVELDQCSGSTGLYACADDNNCASVVPTAKSWTYFSDKKLSCVHSWDPRVRDSCSVTAWGRPSLTLPQRLGNYFLMTNGTGKFELRVQSTRNGIKASPQVVFAGMQTKESAVVTVESVGGNSVTVRWQQARVLLPGIYTPLEADYMTYKAYIFDASAIPSALSELADEQGISGVSFTTTCGLSYASEVLPASAVTIELAKTDPEQQGKDFMTHSFEGLASSSSYLLIIVGSCDSTCLRQLSKVTNDPRITISCSSNAGDCRPQAVVYESVAFDTLEGDDDRGYDDYTPTDYTFIQGLITFSIVVMVMLGVALVGLIAYYVKNNQGIIQTWWTGSNDGFSGRGNFPWDFDDSDATSANSSHGLTSQGDPQSQMFSGFGAQHKVSFGWNRPTERSDGVELESMSDNTSASAGNQEGRRIGKTPIESRGAAESTAAASIGAIGYAISGAATKLFTAANTAYAQTTASSTTPKKVAARNPMHSAPARTTGYIAPDQKTVPPADNQDEMELHL